MSKKHTMTVQKFDESGPFFRSSRLKFGETLKYFRIFASKSDQRVQFFVEYGVNFERIVSKIFGYLQTFLNFESILKFIEEKSKTLGNASTILNKV